MGETNEGMPTPETKKGRPTKEEIQAIANKFLRLAKDNGYMFRDTVNKLNSGDEEDLQMAKNHLTSQLDGWTGEDIRELIDELEQHRKEFDDK